MSATPETNHALTRLATMRHARAAGLTEIRLTTAADESPEAVMMLLAKCAESLEEELCSTVVGGIVSGQRT